MRRLNKITALVIAGVISCTSPMMVMASDSGSVMSQAEEILKDNEVGFLLLIRIRLGISLFM